MQNNSFSPLRSPNKQKPKIPFLTNHSPLKERIIFTNNVAQKTVKASKQVFYPDQNTSKFYIENKENILFKSGQLMTRQQSEIRSNSFLKYFNPNLPSKSSGLSTSSQKFKCQKCSKRKQSYLVVEENMKYCSNCALQEMKKGKQVCNLDQIGNLRSVSPNCLKIKQKCIQINQSKGTQKYQHISKIFEDQAKIKFLIETNLNESKILQNYNNKRQQLKRHYQKLKQIIQISIKKDLQSLKKDQEMQILQAKHKRLKFQKDLKILQKLKSTKESKIEYKDTQNSLINDLIQMDSCQHDEIESHLLDLTFSKKQRRFIKKQYLYDPEVYMMTVEGKLFINQFDQSTKYPAETLFSFQKM